MYRLIGTALFLVVTVVPPVGWAQDVESGADRIQAGELVFEFATLQQGREALGRSDEFIRQLSAFDRQVRTQQKEDPGEKAFLEFVSGEVLAWDPEARQEFKMAIESLRESMKLIRGLSLGPILLIRTTGKEESGAAYTRGKVIVLPVGRRSRKDRLIAHELFHVLSRNYPELRDRLYARIGFRPTNPIVLPGELAERKVTNPDAPEIKHVIDVQLADEKLSTLSPALFASQSFVDDSGMTIFSNLEVRLMEVESGGENQFVAKLKDGKPVMHPLNTPDYLRQIGRNSRVIFHPEEVMANNFSILLVDRDSATDQWVIDAMVEEFERFGAERSKTLGR
ncbi:MAG: hypothetical protein VYA84_03505 [Planctomycetota bacterium]|nr:hypothetical protein [Planctomycetota bacterium]